MTFQLKVNTSTGLQPLSAIVCRCSSCHVLTLVFVCWSSCANTTCRKIHIENWRQYHR